MSPNHGRHSVIDVLVGNTHSGRRRRDRTLSSVEIKFGLDLAEREVVEAMASIAFGGHGTWIAFETRGTSDGIRHFIRAPHWVLEQFNIQLRGLLPTARVEPTSTSHVARATSAVRVCTTRRHTLLREFELRHVSTRLLAALAEPFRQDECVSLRVVLRPNKGEVVPPDGATTLLHYNQIARHQRSKFVAKYDGPCLSAEIVVLARAASDRRAQQLIRPVAHALRSCQGEAGRLRLHPVSASKDEALPPARRWLRGGRFTVSPKEAVALLAWPLGSPQIEGLGLGVAPALPAPKEASSVGRRFAISNAGRSAGRPILQPIDGSLNHSVVLGPTGSGKSTLIANLIRQDIASGRGVLVVDAKGDLIDDVLRHIPAGRERDVIVLDPSSDLPQPGLQLFSPGGDIDLAADHLVATLQELFKSSWGVRSSQYFRLGVTTLGRWRGATILDLPRLFHDRVFRERVLTTVEDPYIVAAWQRFDALSRAEQVQHVASPLTKLQELVGRPRLRTVLGQRSPRLHFGEVLSRRRIVLARLSAGQIGVPAARLLAGLLLWQFFTAVEARSELPRSRRDAFLAYIDEVAAFSGLPLPVDHILERARGLGVGLTLSPQALPQLDRDIQAAVLANVGTFVTFRPASEHEARIAASALPGIDSDALRHLDRFEIALKLSLGPGHTSTTMTGSSIAMPQERISDPNEVRQLAARNYGGMPDEDHQGSSASKPIEDGSTNRRRRAS